jgi:hypothetical protein
MHKPLMNERDMVVRRTSLNLPEITSNARGRYPTPNDAANVATAWPTRVKSGIAELPAVIYRRRGIYFCVAADKQLVRTVLGNVDVWYVRVEQEVCLYQVPLPLPLSK